MQPVVPAAGRFLGQFGRSPIAPAMKKVLLPMEGSIWFKRTSPMARGDMRVAGIAGSCGSAGVSVWVCRARERPVAAGRPLAQMSPGRGAASSFILPRSLPAATGLGLRYAEGSQAFLALVGGSGAGHPCPWRRNKGGGRPAAGGHSPERAWVPSARPTDRRARKVENALDVCHADERRTKKNPPRGRVFFGEAQASLRIT